MLEKRFGFFPFLTLEGAIVLAESSLSQSHSSEKCTKATLRFFFFFLKNKTKQNKKHQKVSLQLESLLFKSEFLNSFTFIRYLSRFVYRNSNYLSFPKCTIIFSF